MDVESAVVVETYMDTSFAEATVALLASEGIEAIIHSDDAGHTLPNLDFASGAQVLVARSDLEDARRILDTAIDSGDESGGS